MSPSPRSSTEASASHNPGTSVFLQSLSHRLRKGSTASHASSQSSEATLSNADHLDRPENIQSSKRYLLSVIRDDWEYPASVANGEDPKLKREATSYRLRDEAVSDYEPAPQRNRRDDPYRFDNPDDVGALIQRRKARKRRLLEQEMAWNEGLRTWTMRRDAWTGAVPHDPRRNLDRIGRQSPNLSQKRRSHDSKHDRNSSDSTGASSGSTPSWPLPTTQPVEDSTAPVDIPGTHADAEVLPDGPYLPIYPPIFPVSHTLRARIKPSTYPTIYSKVVIQSMAPNVPIPLDHMINALVQGWKAEGNWPPTPLAMQPPESRGKPQKPPSAFSRWKKDHEKRNKSISDQSQQVEFEQDDASKGVRKHISGAVKKLIGSRGETAEETVNRELENIGLTFETDEERIDELTDIYEQHLKE